MSLPVTDRAVLTEITGYIAAHGYAPTLRELADACGLSTVGVRLYLQRLERAGAIRRDYAVARGIVVQCTDGK